MKNKIKFFLVLAALIALPLASKAQIYSTNIVHLMWDASVSQDITNYTVYYSTTSNSFPNRVDAGTNLTAFVGGLSNGTKYYFIATCQDIYGMESDPSPQLVYTVPRNKPMAPGNLRIQIP